MTGEQERPEASCGGSDYLTVTQHRGPKVPVAYSGPHVRSSPPARVDILSGEQVVANSVLATSVLAGPEQPLSVSW